MCFGTKKTEDATQVQRAEHIAQASKRVRVRMRAERERERVKESEGDGEGERDRERVMEKDSLNDTHRAGIVPR